MSMNNHGEMMPTGENSWFVHQSALSQSYHQRDLVAYEEDTGEENDGFCLYNISFMLT
jgi:hypothetical protein